MYIAFRDWNTGELISLFDRLQYSWIFLSIAFAFLSIWIRALRWKMILAPLGCPTAWRLFQSTMIGYFGNGFLPARLGEVLKCIAAGKLVPDIPVSSIIGSVVAERTLDLVGLSVVALTVIFLNPLPDWLSSGITVLLILTGSAAVLLFVVARHQQFMAKLFDAAWKRIFKHKANAALAVFPGFLAGLATFENRARIIIISVHTIIYWGMQWGLMHSVALALHLEITWMQTGIVLLATMLATSIPSVPANVGIFHAAAVVVLTSILDLPNDSAIAYAIISHGIRVMLVISVGAVFAAMLLVRQKNLSRH
jgi:glycosyltransferase 2 family protein